MAGFEDFDAGHQLLLASSLVPAAVDISEIVSRLACRIPNWDEFLASVEAHQLRPIVASRLSEDVGALHVPRAVTERLAEGVRALGARALFMGAELVRILAALRAAGVVAVALKGPAFAEFSGAGVASRELTDLDVLIRPFEIESAVGVLASIGYECPLPPQAIRSAWLSRATWELPLIARRGAVLLELHWSLAPRWFPAPVEALEVLATAVEREFAGARVLWPRADELFLIHAVDGMKSGGVGIRWLADLAALLRAGDIDWRRTRDIAARNAGLNIVRVTLAVADMIASTAAASLGSPGLAIELPELARELCQGGRATARLSRAADAICDRLRTDGRIAGAVPHFRWSLQVADRRLRTATAIARYVSGPTVADLAAMPAEGLADLPLRLRAFRRRLAESARSVNRHQVHLPPSGSALRPPTS
jgi:hypothetical protein